MSKRQSQNDRVSGRHKRKINTRSIRQRFLIVCEGIKTEPNYFRSFKTPRVVVDIGGAGAETLRVVEEAQRLYDEDRDEYDQVWCVFDRDSFPVDRVYRAIELAERLGFYVAFSNQSFELWYLLHFHFYNTALPRDDYPRLLSKHLKHEYVKNSTTMYKELSSLQEQAIRNAERLLHEHANPHRYADNDPMTTVHRLVQELNKYRRP